MSLKVELFWSFRSPYSYLATPRLRDLENNYDVDVAVRIVLPLAVRNQNFFKVVNPLWPRYLFRDVLRIAEYHAMTIGWPNPDPVVQDPQTLTVAAEQPYIHRIARLGVAAAEHGRGLAYICEVSHVLWSGNVHGWHEGDHLARAAERAGLDPRDLDKAVERDAARYDAAIEANQAALEEAGHWGVPTMVFNGEPFFGQDRIDLLKWRLEQNGLAKRTASTPAR